MELRFFFTLMQYEKKLLEFNICSHIVDDEPAPTIPLFVHVSVFLLSYSHVFLLAFIIPE